MNTPLQVDLPHTLGREEARARIAGNIGSLASHLPGGAAVQHRWEGDTLHLDIKAMGQSVAGTVRVEERHVGVSVMLGGLLGMMAAPIKGALQKGGAALLEDKRKS